MPVCRAVSEQRMQVGAMIRAAEVARSSHRALLHCCLLQGQHIPCAFTASAPCVCAGSSPGVVAAPRS